MPTDAPAADGPDRPAEAPDGDDLTFAVHDLGRERVAERRPADLGFVPARTAVAAPAPDVTSAPAQHAAPRPAMDGFVIRDAQGAAPAAPVDALVVGAPEPAQVEEDADPDADAAATLPPTSFRISLASATATAPTADELWTTRNSTKLVATETAPTHNSRRGWSTRHSEVVDRSAQATMLRLREEAVNVSWKSAWIAVTTTNPRLLRKRRQQPPA